MIGNLLIMLTITKRVINAAVNIDNDINSRDNNADSDHMLVMMMITMTATDDGDDDDDNREP